VKLEFFLALKTECVRVKCLLTKDDAKNVIGDYIEYYNSERLHSAIGYIAPHGRLNGREKAIWYRRGSRLKERRLESKQLAATG